MVDAPVLSSARGIWLRLGETAHYKIAQWRPVKKRTAIGVGELLAGVLFGRLKVA
jgi:hypothetical protein